MTDTNEGGTYNPSGDIPSHPADPHYGDNDGDNDTEDDTETE